MQLPIVTSQPLANSLVDTYGRVHDNLRISVTDRCNIRCVYCMPAGPVTFMPRQELLSFEEILQLVQAMLPLGIRKIRLTGGEPLVRRGLPDLIRMLKPLEGLEDIGLTTNGILLADQAAALYDAGLRRLNISLDALDEATFREFARRDGLPQVMQGIEAARSAGFDPIKLNAVAIRGLSEAQLTGFAELARRTGVIVRFIEYMPLDADAAWERGKVLYAREIIEHLSREVAPLIPVPGHRPESPATDYQFADGLGRIGFIASISQPFCASCNRIRLTADGKLRNCLFSLEETDLRQLLRDGASAATIQAAIRASVLAKNEGHEINTARFIQPDRPMYSIGG